MEATATLADTLLEDLDDLSDVNELSDNDPSSSEGEDEEEELINGGDMDIDDAQDDKKPSAVPQEELNNQKRKASKKRVFLSDERLNKHIESVDIFDADNVSCQKKEYELIVESNSYLSKLSNEYNKCYRDLCHGYHTKFPELEELVVDQNQYKNAVRLIGNEMDMTKLNDPLNELLNSNQIITISVAGSTTNGKPLEECKLTEIYEIIEYMDRIEDIKKKLTTFIESRMENLAPSVCAIVGATIAARLLGLAGGLAELSKIPACNLQVIGQVKDNAASRAGMSAYNTKNHTGILLECDLVQRCSRHLYKKAVKTVAAKLALAARCDYINVERGSKRSDEAGRKFRVQIEKKIGIWEEPDKAPVIKALPKPDMSTKKRRGGKRIRRLKERFQETDLMKQANKRAFNSEVGEYGDDSMGLTLGMLDTKHINGSNQLRLGSREMKKMRVANTKASRKKALKMNNATSNNAETGLASSMVFTPVQGLELVNPDLNKKKVDDANKKWFKEETGFMSALPK